MREAGLADALPCSKGGEQVEGERPGDQGADDDPERKRCRVDGEHQGAP